MKQGFASALVVVLGALFCGVGAPAGVDQKNDVDNILSSFPGYHLLTLNERDPSTGAFISQHFPKLNPSVVHADFDGDGRRDYAVLVRNEKLRVTKLFILLCSEDGHCRTVYELDVSAYSDMVYLQPAAVGSVASQTDAVDSTDHSSPVRLKSTGIQLTYFEKGTVVLNWNKKLKKIIEVQTAD
jgi:hypothetical protein